jgi:hypothetical protein
LLAVPCGLKEAYERRGPGGRSNSSQVHQTNATAATLGHTNREIARDLFLSPRTIDMHVGSILLKLDCRSRADAARRASELGLLTGSPDVSPDGG